MEGINTVFCDGRPIKYIFRKIQKNHAGGVEILEELKIFGQPGYRSDTIVHETCEEINDIRQAVIDINEGI